MQKAVEPISLVLEVGLKKVKEDIVAMTLYIIAGLIMAVLVFFSFAFISERMDETYVLYNAILTVGFFPIFIFCICLVAIGRIIDLLNQINQKLDSR